jgi:hypothetical protein
MSTITWYRQRHDWFKSTRIVAIARRLDQPLAFVAMLWEAAFNHASKQADRGSVAHFPPEDAGAELGIDDAVAARIWAAFVTRGMIAGDRIANWEELEPIREDPTAAERKRRQRERDQELADDVTQCHTTSRPHREKESPPSGPPKLKVVASRKIEKRDGLGADAPTLAFAAAGSRKPKVTQKITERWIHARLADAAHALPEARHVALVEALTAIEDLGRLSVRGVLKTVPREVRHDLETLDREAKARRYRVKQVA